MSGKQSHIWVWVSAVLLLLCFSTTANAQTSSPLLVQTAAKASPSSAKTLSLAFSSNTVAGDLILVAFDHDTSALPTSVADSQGNVFTEVGTQLNSPGGARSRVYYAKSIKGGADTVTVTLSANSAWIELYLSEYSGVDPVNPIDAQAGAVGNAGAVSSGNATTTVAGDVIYGYCLADSTCTVGSGFAARSTLNNNLIEDKAAGNPGAYAAIGAANNGWTMQLVALKPASSGVGGPPAITSGTTASGTVGSAFSYQITATNTPTSYGATGLPAGLSVNTSSGVISGTPTAAATSTVTLSATNANGTGNATLTVTINPAAPVITSATTASGVVGSAFSYQITATNTPTSYGATGLPAGLSVSTATGLISGTPTIAGTSTVTLKAINAGGTGNAALTLTINTAPPAITSAATASGVVGIAFSYQITATNTPTSYGATGLPAGLSVNTGTGLISGTPTTIVTSTVTLSATNAGGTGNATLTVTINPPPPAITSATTATGQVGTVFSYQITGTNTPTSYGATGLPAGLSVNSPSGLISGTPTTAGTSTVTLSATNAGGTGNATLTLTINPAPPVITSGTTAGGTVGTAFSYQIAATNTPTSYGATGLPAGLSVNTGTGLISGAPTTVGSSTVTLSATNAGGTGNATLTVTINPAPPAITSATTAGGAVGTPFSYQITATNTPTSYGATGLPGGLSVNAGTGLISGTPTTAGSSTVTLSATNSAGTGNATLTVTITVAPPAITSGTTANGVAGSAFSYQITATNTPTSYGATGLPAGLSVNTGTGLISGTPTTAGVSTVTLSATNASGTGNATLTLTIAVAPPVITSATTASGVIGSAFSYQITATNTPTSYGATGLPAGLSVNTGTGLISGTPTTVVTATVTLSATNAGGTGNASLTLTINPAPPAITSATTASGGVGTAFSYQITATNTPTSYGATGLPAGLSVNTGTGLISGTPTAAGTSTVTLSATNAGGTGNGTLTITVNPAPPAITSATTASGGVGAAFSYQIVATNTPTSYGATGLPAGLSVNTGTGLISGTPTAAGSSTVTLSATNAGGTGNASLSLTISAVVAISLVQTVAKAAPGSASTLFLAFPANTAAGDLILVAFDYDTSALPTSVADSQGNVFTEAGTQLNSAGGGRSRVYYAKNIKGGADTVTVTLSANSAWIELYLSEYSGVDQVNPIDAQIGATGNAGAVSSGNATTTVAGDVIYGYCLADSTCTVGSGFAARSTLNNNLIEDKAAGNPGAYAASGTANNSWTMQMVALKPASPGVGASPVITSGTTASGTVGSAFSYQITATNTPTSYGATGLPAGLSVNTSSGVISGTPTAAATSTVTLSATNAYGTGNATLTITVIAAVPSITSSSTAGGTVGTAFFYQITATNAPTSFGASGLPAGLTADTGTGQISGVPTVAGTFAVTLTAANSQGSGSAPLTVVISNAGTGPIISHTVQISNDADDGYYNNQDSSGWHSSSQFSGSDRIGSWGGTRTAWVIGYRFPSLGVNSGDMIQSAYVEVVSSTNSPSSFTCGSAPCAGGIYTFRVYGVAQDNGVAFTGTAGNTPLDVPYTAAYTDYTATGPGDVHGGCHGDNNGQNTCTHIIDVTNIVREITTRPGWTNTSAIRFVLLSMDNNAPNVYAGFQDSSATASKAATLVVNPAIPTIVSSGAFGTSASPTYPLTYNIGPYVYPGASTLLLYLGDYYTFFGLPIPQPTVSDSCGNTWNILAGPANWPGIAYDLRSTVYYAQNPVSCPAGATISIFTSVQEPIFVHFLAVAGSDTVHPPVASAITSPAPGIYTSTAASNPVTLTNGGLLVSWIFGDSDAPHTFTPQAGFITDTNSTPNYLTAVFANVASPGSYQSQFSITPSSDGWQVVMLGLQAP